MQTSIVDWNTTWQYGYLCFNKKYLNILCIKSRCMHTPSFTLLKSYLMRIYLKSKMEHLIYNCFVLVYHGLWNEVSCILMLCHSLYTCCREQTPLVITNPSIVFMLVVYVIGWFPHIVLAMDIPKPFGSRNL